MANENTPTYEELLVERNVLFAAIEDALCSMSLGGSEAHEVLNKAYQYVWEMRFGDKQNG